MLDFQGQRIVLKPGQWSRWTKLDFELLPFKKISGICRFFLQEATPNFRLYVTPINMDPSDPGAEDVGAKFVRSRCRQETRAAF